MYMFVCQMITFESLDVGSSYLHMGHIFAVYGSTSYMKVIRSSYHLTDIHTDRHKTDRHDNACECRVSCGLLPTPVVASVNTRSLSFDAAKLLVQAFIPTRLEWTIATHYCAGSATICTDAYKPFKRRSTPHHQHEKVRAHHARPAAATLASSPSTCSIQDRRADVQCTLRPLLPAYLKTCVTLSLDSDDCVCRTSTHAIVQRTNTRFSDRSFAAAGPR